MIKKDNLIESLSQLVEIKKTAIPLFEKHISSSLTFSGLSEQQRAELLEKMQATVVNFKKHIVILEDMQKDIRDGGQDVY